MNSQQKSDFSIIIATYNEEKYLPDCLAAIKNQNFKGSKEIIIIDSHSTDNTLSIAEKAGVKIFQTKKEGPGLAKRAGCLKAKADLVAFIDADITIPKNWLQTAYRNLENPKVVATGGPYLFRTCWKFFKPLNKALYLLILKLFKLLPGGSIAFKKKSYFEAGGIPKGVTFGEDVYLCSRLSKVGKIMVDPKLSVVESGRRLSIKGLINGYYSYLKQTFKFFKSGNVEELKKIKMENIS